MEDDIYPMKLMFGDTVHMPTNHDVHGAMRRLYVYIGTARKLGQDPKAQNVPVFCTLQTSKRCGPVALKGDSTTFCRPEVSIHTKPPQMSSETLSEVQIRQSYFAGSRGMIREGIHPNPSEDPDTKHRSDIEFLNLCQLAVIELPERGTVRASIAKRQVCDDCLQVFKEELEHLKSSHEDIWSTLCELYIEKDDRNLQQKLTSLQEDLEKEIAAAKRHKKMTIPNLDTKCACDFPDRIRNSILERKEQKSPSWWKRGRRFFRRPDASFPEKALTGAMRPFRVKQYNLNGIEFDLSREPLSERWEKLVRKATQATRRPSTAPGKTTGVKRGTPESLSSAMAIQASWHCT